MPNDDSFGEVFRAHHSHRLLSDEQKDLLFGMRAKYASMTYRALHKRFIIAWYGNFGRDANKFSVECLRKACVEDGFTRKRLEFYNCRTDEVKRRDFLRSIEHLSEAQIVSIDGMVQSRQDYRARSVYARKGQRAVQRQFIIRLPS